MVQSLDIVGYRKLKKIKIDFVDNLNFISGTNGTCKTSLLHMISNSFQKVKNHKEKLTESDCLTIINQINDKLNPKIESLTKGDKKKNDPAPHIAGTLYRTNYVDKSGLDFRRHNSSVSDRYAIKPYYPKGESQRLPELPVVYLGLNRLVSYGEIEESRLAKSLAKRLPDNHLDNVKNLYEELTGIKIDLMEKINSIDGLKKRASFTSKEDGIDSNTISAGEDNLLIILMAVESLAYYYSCLKIKDKDVESILLIDEIDATLHPSLQVKLMDILNNYSLENKIQMFFTTHSFTLLEEASRNKHNIVYLVDNEDSVDLLEDSSDIDAIKMHLNNETIFSYVPPKIPVFTEDNEARIFLKELLMYKEEQNNDFGRVSATFHYVETNIGADSLKNIFEDSLLLRTTMKSICILDGDQNECITNCIITLPGKKSPEEFFFEYSEKLYKSTTTKFWTDGINIGFSKAHYRTSILSDINRIDAKISKAKKEKISTKGMKREENKKVFTKHEKFFILVMRYWVREEENRKEINKFFNSLKAVYCKVCEFNNINKNLWID